MATDTNPAALASSASANKIAEPIGRQLATNLRQIRGRVTVRELSRWLSEIGHPILPSGITKIEQGTRRVDVDDLVALAAVLNCSPNRLLLAPEADEAEIPLTSGVRTTRRSAWQWATGEKSLPLNPLDDAGVIDFDRDVDFRNRNRPHQPQGKSTFVLSAVDDQLRPVGEAADAVIAGAVLPDGSALTLDDVIDYLQLRRAMAEMRAQAREIAREMAKLAKRAQRRQRNAAKEGA